MAKETKYTKLDPISHILTRPDMYVGSKNIEQISGYIYSDNKLSLQTINISPAFVRVFVEILSNAVDNNERDTDKMTYILVKINESTISIKNDGSVIPIKKNKDGIYNHSLIFGHLLSGSNYDDKEKRFTAGRNGLGAKLTNVLSTEFTVEAVDSSRKLKLTQKWSNNMRTTSEPIITKSELKGGYTKITWKPDLKWFGMKEINNQIITFLTALVLDAGMVTGLKTTVNDVVLPNKLNGYFDLMTMPEKCTEMLKLNDENSKVFVTPSKNGFEQISFVNGIKTKNGGKHVTAWVDAVCKPIINKVCGKKCAVKLNVKDIKTFFRFLIVTRIPNPEFESQEKNELKTPLKTTPISTAQVNKILTWSIGDDLKSLALKKEKKKAVKDINTSSKHPVISGYDRANLAGTKHGKDCTLIVCEGLSAKTFCVQGISEGVIGLAGKGRDYFGIYPLRGKILNTRKNSAPSSICKNAVVNNLINILGLDYGNPDKINNLNYGHLLILTDADTDGIHIEGLILNLFHSLFPQLIKKNFILGMKTPIVRVGVNRYFYDERAWKLYLEKHNKQKLEIKYHKGLGTIKQDEVKKVFGQKILQFIEDEETNKSFTIAFGKEESSERKLWISKYSPITGVQESKYPTLDEETSKVIPFTISRHLNTELIKFFYDDCKRSLPNVIDGLKESQRKIVYTVKLRNDTKPIKVAQLAAAVAEKTAYHHGEQNLSNTIIKMAQSFIGSNNMPLLTEEGAFGSRLEGGEDAASPRYVSVKKRKYFDTIFLENDDELLSYIEEDGLSVEPFYYVPSIPVLLINGAVGIGTGWSCSCPLFNPKDVLKGAQLWMLENKKEFENFVINMVPWYKNFQGTIQKTDVYKYKTVGLYTKTNNVTKVTELPIGMWTSSFIDWLNEKDIKYVNKSTPEIVEIYIHDLDSSDFEKKMTTTLSTDNIVIFDENKTIKKVTLADVFNIWGAAKLKILAARKKLQLEKLSREKHIADIKYKFITAVKVKTIDLTEEINVVVNKLSSITIIDEEQKILLDMNVRSLTNEKCAELIKKIKELEQQIKMLKTKTEKELWQADIEKMLTVFQEN